MLLNGVDKWSIVQQTSANVKKVIKREDESNNYLRILNFIASRTSWLILVIGNSLHMNTRGLP